MRLASNVWLLLSHCAEHDHGMIQVHFCRIHVLQLWDMCFSVPICLCLTQLLRVTLNYLPLAQRPHLSGTVPACQGGRTFPPLSLGLFFTGGRKMLFEIGRGPCRAEGYTITVKFKPVIRNGSSFCPLEMIHMGSWRGKQQWQTLLRVSSAHDFSKYKIPPSCRPQC